MLSLASIKLEPTEGENEYERNNDNTKQHHRSRKQSSGEVRRKGKCKTAVEEPATN